MNVVADEQRTPKGMLRDMKFAIEVGEPVNGLKGPSPLASVKGFDLVLGQAVEYMHCVLLGVTKCFADTWFDTSNNQEPDYIAQPVVEQHPEICHPPLPRNGDSLESESRDGIAHHRAAVHQHCLSFFRPSSASRTPIPRELKDFACRRKGNASWPTDFNCAAPTGVSDLSRLTPDSWPQDWRPVTPSFPTLDGNDFVVWQHSCSVTMSGLRNAVHKL
ncbi:hypothetical protein MTO96_025014 [Rhipicephalus appendiculatus]